jgi:hypothetical protein
MRAQSTTRIIPPTDESKTKTLYSRKGINAADMIYFSHLLLFGDLFGTTILTRPQQGCREDNNSNTTCRSRYACSSLSLFRLAERSGSSSDGGERDSKRKVQEKLLCAEDSSRDAPETLSIDLSRPHFNIFTTSTTSPTSVRTLLNSTGTWLKHYAQPQLEHAT